MRFLLTDDDGRLVNTVTVSGTPHVAIHLDGEPQYSGTASRMFVIEHGAGKVFGDMAYVRPARDGSNVGTVTPIVTPFFGFKDVQHEGLEVYEVYPEAIAASVAALDPPEAP